jgi:predicted nucleic acid-binding protein
VKNIVLDASVCLNWYLRKDKLHQTSYASAFAGWLIEESAIPHVPIHFDLEVAGTLLKTFRNKSSGFTDKQLNAALDDMDRLPVNFHAMGMGYRQMSDLARAYNLSMYDTPYFNLARAFEFVLATEDRGLISAAKVWGVEVWQPI